MATSDPRNGLRRDIVSTVRYGKTTVSRAMVVHTSLAGGGRTRTAIVVSRQTEKSAVERNRLKRRLRPILRRLGPRLAPQTIVVLRVRPAARRLSADALEREVVMTLRRSHVLT